MKARLRLSGFYDILNIVRVTVHSCLYCDCITGSIISDKMKKITAHNDVISKEKVNVSTDSAVSSLHPGRSFTKASFLSYLINRRVIKKTL